jgi:hypothetical protein
VAHPIVLRVSDDLTRSRLTVAFRLVLVIPHLVWLSVWGIATYAAVVVSWFATLLAGRTPAGLHRFIARYLRYATRVYAYLFFVADPYPGFLGEGSYEADLAIAPPAPQSRWATAFRIVLAIPALVVAQVLANLLQLLGIISWFACLFRGAMPRGLRDIEAWIIRFGAQTHGYVALLTDRYPSFSTDPSA